MLLPASSRTVTAVALVTVTASCVALATWLVGRGYAAAHAAGASVATRAFHAEFRTAPGAAKAGEPLDLSFLIKNSQGATVRFLQFVHEKPLHLLIVSEDLAEFYHIHPEMQVDDSYAVRHTFPNGGRYRLYADYTPPGSGMIVDQFNLRVDGPERPRARLVPDTRLIKAANGLRVELSSDAPLQAGKNLMVEFALTDERTAKPVNNLQLYLGALGHFVIISEDLHDFIHAHPLDTGEVFDPSQDPSLHVHDPAQLARKLVGSSPSEVSAYVNFPRAGMYKLWAQFQRDGRVINVPFVLDVAAGEPEPVSNPDTPDAMKINVTSSGYVPAQISVNKGEPVRLAFYRADTRNCAGTVVFPELNITRELPVGQTVTVEFTPTRTGEFSFTCGMGMFKGVVVVN
jgi:plastocyanin